MKLNLGSFSVMFPGWINVDKVNHPALYAQASAEGCMYYSMDLRFGMPFAPNSIELIHCSHMVEHLTYREGEAFMADCYRIMKPGATARFAVPDAKILIRMYQEKRLLELDAINEPSKKTAKYPLERFWNVLTEDHKAAYDWESFHALCYQAGFNKIERKAYNEGHPTIIKECKDLFPEISLYVECTR